MASIVSLYSAAVSANVPSDNLAPEAPVLGSITASQDDNGGAIPQGRSTITLNWALPTLNLRIPGEFLIQADGAAQNVELLYDPIAASPVHKLYEVTGQTGASTTLSAGSSKGEKFITVTSLTGISDTEWFEIGSGGTREFVQVSGTPAGNNVPLAQPLISDHSAAETVVETQVTLKTITTDYTITLATGAVALLTGQFTNGNDVFVEYSVTLQDLDHFELYRIPGNIPVSEPADYATITGHGSVVTVDDAILSSATQSVDVLAAAENGETWSYYLFALDDETVANVSPADAVMVETFLTIPQGLEKSVGDAQLVLSWDAITDDNFNGVNIYRDDGATFEASTAVKANSSLVSGTVFDDSAGNVTNRVVEGTLAFPVNGSAYSYKIEAEDTTTAWSTGTNNQSSGQAAQVTASKTA